MKLVDWLLLSTSGWVQLRSLSKRKVVGWSFCMNWLSWVPSRGEVEAYLPCPDSIGRIHPRMLTAVHYPTRSWWNHVKWCVDLNLQKSACETSQNLQSNASSIRNHVQLSPCHRKCQRKRSCSHLNRGSMEPSINLSEATKKNQANWRWPTESKRENEHIKLGLNIHRYYIDIEIQ